MLLIQIKSFRKFLKANVTQIAILSYDQLERALQCCPRWPSGSRCQCHPLWHRQWSASVWSHRFSHGTVSAPLWGPPPHSSSCTRQSEKRWSHFALLVYHTKKSQLHIPFNFGSFLRHFTLQFNSLIHCGFYRLQLFHYVHRQFYIGPKEYIIKSLAGSVQESQHLSVLSRFEHEIVGWTHLSQTVQWCTSLLLQRLSRQHHRLSDSC